ncbi:FkbM family methyltransferase [Litoreibacter sp.]|nr:FkbM family methyltransferase [Litoreibacter sp.]
MTRQSSDISREPEIFTGIDVVSCEIDGKPMLFAVDMENDPIQRNHRRGQFYELKELRLISRWFPKGGVFVDIGANVGNHSLFVARFLQPAAVIPFEPNPLAYKLLRANVHLNGWSDVFDLRHLGFGVSAGAASGYAMEKRDRNLGGAKMLEGEGEIEVRSGDEMLSGVAPSMIKIDVEGMEMDVLSGLEATVTTFMPPMMVEVDDENADAFGTWVKAHGYKTQRQLRHYKTNENFFIVPDQQART